MGARHLPRLFGNNVRARVVVRKLLGLTSKAVLTIGGGPPRPLVVSTHGGDMLTVRCSSLDRVMACAGSLIAPAAPYNPNSPEAREGTAGHEALALIVAGQEPDLDVIAAKHDVDRDELERIVSRGRNAWVDLQKWFPNPTPEIQLSDTIGGKVELRGTTDLLSVATELAALDWKFGWAPSEHTYQLQGYGRLAVAKHGMPASGHVLCCEVWVRVGEIRVRRYDADALMDFDRQLLSQVERIGQQYGPGLDACRYCPHQNACPSRDEWMRSAATALGPVTKEQALTRDLIGSLYEKSKMLAKALEHYDSVLKAMLVDGPVPLPDGRALTLEEHQQDKIRPSKAIPYLRESLRLTPEEADEALSVSKGALERVVKARSEKGKGAAAIRETMTALKAVGAIEKVSRKTIKVTTG